MATTEVINKYEVEIDSINVCIHQYESHNFLIVDPIVDSRSIGAKVIYACWYNDEFVTKTDVVNHNELKRAYGEYLQTNKFEFKFNSRYLLVEHLVYNGEFYWNTRVSGLGSSIVYKVKNGAISLHRFYLAMMIYIDDQKKAPVLQNIDAKVRELTIKLAKNKN
jgi:hypothetical protein